MQNREDNPKFIQQHLANERTYLAWVRTSIAIIGLGFLAAGLVFHSDKMNRAGHLISSIGGIGAVLMGGSMLVLATRDFFRKRKGINEERFETPALLIWFVFAALGMISVLLVFVVILMLL